MILRNVENGIGKWKFDLLTNHQLADVSSKHYMETSDLLYLRKEIDIDSKRMRLNLNRLLTLYGEQRRPLLWHLIWAGAWWISWTGILKPFYSFSSMMKGF